MKLLLDLCKLLYKDLLRRLKNCNPNIRNPLQDENQPTKRVVVGTQRNVFDISIYIVVFSSIERLCSTRSFYCSSSSCIVLYCISLFNRRFLYPSFYLSIHFSFFFGRFIFRSILLRTLINSAGKKTTRIISGRMIVEDEF